MAEAVAPPAWLWVVFTLVAATAQTFRNATQRSLIDQPRNGGATHIRFIFGLPFGILALLGIGFVWGEMPMPNVQSVLWTAMGAVSQIVATAMMLSAMRERSFVVTTAYIKTEPVQVAVFAMVFLGERITPTLAAAVIIATAGVLALSWPSRAGREIYSWRPALLGIAAGGFFAFAAVGFRGGITALRSPEFVPAATLTLAVSLAIQTALLYGLAMAVEAGHACRPSSRAGALHCRRASWAPSRRKCGSSRSPSRTRRACARWRWSRS